MLKNEELHHKQQVYFEQKNKFPDQIFVLVLINFRPNY